MGKPIVMDEANKFINIAIITRDKISGRALTNFITIKKEFLSVADSLCKGASFSVLVNKIDIPTRKIMSEIKNGSVRRLNANPPTIGPRIFATEVAD